MKENTCCFFGHRKIEDSLELREKLREVIETLITKENIDTFLFGSKSDFNYICREIVAHVKQKHPHIKRVYVRAEYPYINNDYKNFLLERYDDTFFPKHIINAGMASYVERNFYMIDESSVCVTYRKPDCPPKSGTELAYNYAIRRGKKIINLY